MTPTLQQQTVIDWVRNPQNIISNDGIVRYNGEVIARAGTGKTSLLMMCFPEMQGRVAATAYNKDIANEIEDKVKKSGMLHVDVGTSHRFGLRMWNKAAPRTSIDINGSEWWHLIVNEVGIPREFRGFVRSAINFARQRAFGILCPLNDPQAWLKLAADYNLEEKLWSDPSAIPAQMRDRLLKDALRATHKALVCSIRMGEKILDGEGMIYLPLINNVYIEKFDWLVMDEAQDINPARRVLAKRMMKDNARALFVGDPRQAINAWAGADSNSMDIVHDDFHTQRFPLTVTWRCPKLIVERAKSLVSDYEAAPEAPEGQISEMNLDKFSAEAFLKSLVPGEDVIICRNTRPLVEMAFRMVKSGVACCIRGKGLSKPLIALARRWEDVVTIEELDRRLDDYLAKETQRLMSADREEQADMLNDQVEALKAFMEDIPATASIGRLVDRISELFADDNKGAPPRGVHLMTAHGSKGLEYDNVYLLGANRFMPSRRARTRDAVEQEMNLMYVAWTRAKKKLVDVHYPMNK